MTKDTERRVSIQPTKIKAKELVSMDYHALIDDGHTLEEVLNPDYWVHFAAKLPVHSLIHCAWVDGSAYAILRVIQANANWVKTQVILHTKFEDRVADPTPARALYKIDNTQSGWRVIHGDTGAVLAENLPNRNAAEKSRDAMIAEKTQ